MSLSIIIPCYNESSRKGISLEDRISFVCNYMYTNFEDFEIVLVSDGSTDDTGKVINRLAYESCNIVPVVYPENKGKGYAIKKGVLTSTKGVVLIMDADLSTDISSIRSFYAEVSHTDSVIGIRKETYNSNVRLGLSYLSKFCMENILGLKDISDTQCGFKMLKGDLIRKFCENYQMCNNWLVDAELLVFLRVNGYNILSKPVDWTNNEDSRVRVLRGTLTSCFELLRIFSNRRHYKIKSNIE